MKYGRDRGSSPSFAPPQCCKKFSEHQQSCIIRSAVAQLLKEGDRPSFSAESLVIRVGKRHYGFFTSILAAMGDVII